MGLGSGRGAEKGGSRRDAEAQRRRGAEKEGEGEGGGRRDGVGKMDLGIGILDLRLVKRGASIHR